MSSTKREKINKKMLDRARNGREFILLYNKNKYIKSNVSVSHSAKNNY